MFKIIDKSNKIICVIFSLFGFIMFIALCICVSKTDIESGENVYEKFGWLIDVSRISFLVAGVGLCFMVLLSTILFFTNLEEGLWDNISSLIKTFVSGLVLIASISLPFNGKLAIFVYGVVVTLGILSLMSDCSKIIDFSKKEEQI